MKGSWRLIAVPLLAVTFSAHAADDARTPLYYQDPSGAPFYAAGPKKTPDQRDYVPVFEDQPAAGSAAAAAPGGGKRRILYYRNPMGLPDTSPVPKKHSMGMDYLPVYADEDTAGDARGTVRISQGRIQTLGVRTEEAVMRPPLTRTIRATGALQFNERRLATVTTKVPGWIERLAVAATGDPVQARTGARRNLRPRFGCRRGGISRRRAHGRHDERRLHGRDHGAWRSRRAHRSVSATAARARCARGGDRAPAQVRQGAAPASPCARRRMAW